MARASVFGPASLMISVIGAPLTTDTPGSPDSRFPRKTKYWTPSGLSRPSFSFRLLSMTTACVGDAMAVTMSPGVARSP